MLVIFKYIGELLTHIVVFWQGVNIGGFRPFWYLVGISLLTVFGFLIKGLLFSGAGGSSASKLAVSRTKIKPSKKK